MKRTFIVDDRRVDAKVLGNGRTTVLFFHGFGSSAEALPFDKSLLAKHDLQLLCLNRPGISRSTLQKNFTIDSIAADAKEILAQLNIRQCVVAGWSAGGLFAQAFAQNYPQHVLSLHLLSSAIPFGNKDARKVLPGRWKSIALLNRFFPLAAKLVFRSVSKKAQRAPEQLKAESIKEMVAADKAVAGDERFSFLLQQAALEGFANNGSGVYQEAKALCKATIDYNRISCPVHIWSGEQDNIWPLAIARYLHDCLPQSELHIFRNSGHLLYLKEWERIISAFAFQSCAANT